MVSAPSLAARRPAPTGGFTLTELLAVLAIMSIVAAIGAPSFSGLVAGQRSKSISSDLFSALSRARSEAITRNTEVTLLPATAGQWQAGWTIPNPADSGHQIDQHGAVTGATVSGPASVVYMANGRVKGSAEPAFDISVQNLAQHRCVMADLSGRPYQKNSACT